MFANSRSKLEDFGRGPRSGAASTLTMLALLGGSIVAPHARADSAVGVDTMLGNLFVPTGLDPMLQPDPRGLGTFRQPVSHTPSGQLYNLPWTPPVETINASGWTTSGYVDLLGLTGDGSSRNAKFREYSDPHDGITIDAFGFHAERPGEALYVDVIGGGVGRRDQFYGLEAGRYNAYGVKLFYDEIPHTFTNGRSFYDGLGTPELTLPAGLTPGNSSLAAIQAAANGAGDTTIALTRQRYGIKLDAIVDENWKIFAGYTLEHRSGDRPISGGWFFPLAFGPEKVGGISELTEPIAYQTHDFLGGLQYADPRQQFNVTVGASLFRNDNPSLTWQNPFNIGSLTAAGQANAPNFREGQYALYPDNDAYFAKGEYARSFPELMNSRFNATVSYNRMTQNAALLAPQTNTGLAGAVPPFYNLTNWSSTADLSRATSEARIDTKLVDLGWTMQPASKLTLRAKARYYETDNHTSYTSYNPVTGQYGYLAEGGGQGNIIPGESGIYNGTNNLQYRSVPYDGHQATYGLEGDYRIASTTTLTTGFEREQFERHYRERDRTNENRAKLAVSSRALEIGTLRVSYEHGNRTGSEYHYDPYTQFYTSSLPGYTGASTETPFTLAEMRKYDVSDRRQDVVNVRFNAMITETLDGSISAQSKINHYPALYGRVDRQRLNSLNFDLNWTPTTNLTSYFYYSYQEGRLDQANINDNANGMVGSADAGGNVYPLANAWHVASRDRDHTFGAGLTKVFHNGMAFDTKLTRTISKTGISYDYATPGGAALGDASLATPDLGHEYPPMSYKELTLEAGLNIPLNKQASTRVFGRLERVSISDWHYLGLDQDLVETSNAGAGLLNAVYLDPGPVNFRNFVIGILLHYRL